LKSCTKQANTEKSKNVQERKNIFHFALAHMYRVLSSAVRKLEDNISEVGHWMSANRLKLNADKTDLLKAQAGHIKRLRSITPAWHRCHNGE